MRTGKSHVQREGFRVPRKYPRAYGEETFTPPQTVTSSEISPCVRGRAWTAATSSPPTGNTPVRTGKRPCPPERSPRFRKYPRAYGEEDRLGQRRGARSEIPPCVRGRVHLGIRGPHPEGNTPVRTGKRAITCGRTCRRRKYPRAYGEEPTCSPSSRLSPEIPPCVRGRVCWLRMVGRSVGNTPVRTGKRSVSSPASPSARKYPRAYGEEAQMGLRPGTKEEIPPCVRGRVGRKPLYRRSVGNTPVRTGKSRKEPP